MRAFVRCGELELALHGPLAACLGVVADLLDARSRTTLDRIALIDRERAPGHHRFERIELLHLAATAHALLVSPPDRVRRLRRVMTGPLPTAERIGTLVTWLRDQCGDAVVYDLWTSSTTARD